MPVNNTVIGLQFCSVCRMGLTDTEHTVLREISGSRWEGKTGVYGKFHIDDPRRANQIAETEVDGRDEKCNKTSVGNVKTTFNICGSEHHAL